MLRCISVLQILPVILVLVDIVYQAQVLSILKAEQFPRLNTHDFQEILLCLTWEKGYPVPATSGNSVLHCA